MVTPILDSISNYRPISILPVFSKVLERIMYNRVYNHLDSKGLLYEKQFGFQRNNSTEQDLSKAFHTVDHQILI